MSSYTFGEKLRFSAGARGRRFLASGWSPPEPGHCWSNGEAAEIVLPLAVEPSGDVMVRFRCRGYCPRPDSPRQEVVVSVNGNPAGRFEAGGTAWMEVVARREWITGQRVVLALEFPGAVSPASVGASTDTRSLAISMESMVLFELALPSSAGAKLVGAGADPMGDVFVAGESYHRAIRRNGRGSEVFHVASEKGIFRKLANEGLIPEHAFRVVDDPAYEAVASTVTGSPVYPAKYPWLMFKDAARAWIDINRILHDESNGTLGLCDGHYGNFVQFDNARPKWCDIGSIVDQEGALATGYAEFVRCYMLPLALASIPLQEGFNIRQMMVRNTDGVSIAAALAEHGPALARIGLDEHYPPGSRRRALDGLATILDGLDLRAQKGYWSEYRSAEALERAWNGELLRPGNDTRFAQVVALAKSCNVGSFIDVGCNDGIFTLLCSREGMRGFGLEPDEEAINKLYTFARTHADTELAISYGGFMDVEGRHPLVLLLALTHHLVLTQKLSFEQVARQLAKVSSQHVITEFMPAGLGGTPVNPNPVPDPLPPGYSLDGFVGALQAEFEQVRVIDYDRRADPAHMSQRILIHCQSPRA